MKFRSFGLAVAVSSALFLSACGGTSPDASSEEYADAGAPASAASDNGKKAGGSGKVKCPAKVNKALPGPDIIGLKLNMTQAEALNLVQCHMPDAVITYGNEWFNTRNLNTGQMRLQNQMVFAQAGETTDCSYGSYDAMQKCGAGNRQWNFTSEKITLATPGIPGKETLVGIWRSQYWKEGSMPAKDGVLAALTEKYGPYQRYEGRNANWFGYINIYYWATDSAGNVLSEAHPMLQQCSNGVRAKDDESQSWANGCGVSITANVRTFRDNPDVVEELSIGLMNQTELYQYGENFQAELGEIESRRRADELEKAQDSKVEL